MHIIMEIAVLVFPVFASYALRSHAVTSRLSELLSKEIDGLSPSQVQKLIAPRAQGITLLAAAMPPSDSLMQHLRLDRRIRVGSGRRPVVIQTGQEQIDCDVLIRPVRPIDPPILVSLPALVVT